MIDAMEKSGKKPIPSSIAYYSIQRTKSGRRSYGDSRTDVMNPGYQMDNEGSVLRSAARMKTLPSAI